MYYAVPVFVEDDLGDASDCYDHRTGQPIEWPVVQDGRDMVVGVIETGQVLRMAAVDQFTEMQFLWEFWRRSFTSSRIDWYVGRVKDRITTGTHDPSDLVWIFPQPVVHDEDDEA